MGVNKDGMITLDFLGEDFTDEALSQDPNAPASENGNDFDEGEGIDDGDTDVQHQQPAEKPGKEAKLPDQQQQQKPGKDGKPVVDPKKPADNTRSLPGSKIREVIPKSGVFTDEQGNIVTKEGVIVARAGGERNHFFKAYKANEELQRVSAENQRMRTVLEQTQLLNDMPRQMGITPDEVRESMTLVAEFKKNPVAVARDLVERVLALGHNLTDILGTDANSVDHTAIAKMIDQRLAPITAKETADQQRLNEDNEAAAAYKQFVLDHEYADVHHDAIVELMRRQNFDPQRAYFELRMWAVTKGLDFSKPLQPQVGAMLAQQTGKEPGQQEQQRARRPMVNGRGNAANAEQTSDTEKQSYGDTDSWKSILAKELAALN